MIRGNANAGLTEFPTRSFHDRGRELTGQCEVVVIVVVVGVRRAGRVEVPLRAATSFARLAVLVLNTGGYR